MSRDLKASAIVATFACIVLCLVMYWLAKGCEQMGPGSMIIDPGK